MKKILSFLWILLVLTGCAMYVETYAPVTDISMIESIPKNGLHRVHSDETLYSIAWRYGLDYRFIAKRNNIASPYTIQSGQILYLTKNTLKQPLKTEQNRKIPLSKPKPIAKKESEPYANIHYWLKPSAGSIITPFSSSNKGINIGGRQGDPVLATASGKVVYSGNGLRGYGNLIIIKHNSTYLSAYAHNSHVFVKDGDWVKMGEKIAEMGSTGSRRVMLHFEIRRNGQPVNPSLYLAGKV